MTRSKKSSRWAARQNRDPYARRARAEGMRARSAYKLEQIDRKHRLLARGMRVVELGAAPGGWSQYAAARIGGGGLLIAVDLAEMPPLANARILRGDFTAPEVQAQILDALGARAADLVLSDLAPNLSGIRSADQARAAEMLAALPQFCRRALRPGGALLAKLFAGESEPQARAGIAAVFASARGVKPPASRAQSTEFYLLARGHRPNPPDSRDSPDFPPAETA